VADFSARGGEVAKPDIVAPGVAYSSVPLWNAGDEVKQGTSMAAPHVSGLAAILLSAMAQERRPVDARSLRQALMVTARPAQQGTYLDEGRGLPDLDAAYRWLAGGGTAPALEVRIAGERTTGAWVVRAPGAKRRGTVTFEIHRPPGSPRVAYALRSDAPWLTARPSVTLAGAVATVELRYDGDSLAGPGAHTGVISAWPADTLAGPAFRLVTTVVLPAAAADTAVRLRHEAPVKVGEVLRSFFRADSARPFELRVAAGAGQQGFAYLHEPGGAAFREVGGRPLGAGDQQAVYRVDARDVVAGDYQSAALPAPGGRLSVSATVTHAPVTVTVRQTGGTVAAELVNVTARAARLGVELRLRGAQRVDTIRARGSAIRRLPFEIPAWATGLEVDVAMPRSQWGRFTDFGVTVLDSAGRQLAQDPMEYAFGRLSTLLPEGHGGTAAELALYPGFADPGDDQEWNVTTTIRLYADSAVAVPPIEGGGEIALDSRRKEGVRFGVPAPPWTLPPGFGPLVVFLVREGDRVWTRESGLEGSGR
jgi:hypothetical protein